MTDKVAQKSTGKKTAGAFDVRSIIGMLLSVYGVILTLMGLLGDAETDKTGGTNANLWAGLALLVVGLGFLAWVRLRPLVVPPETAEDESEVRRTEP